MTEFRIHMIMTKKLTTDEFIEKFRIMHIKSMIILSLIIMIAKQKVALFVLFMESFTKHLIII